MVFDLFGKTVISLLFTKGFERAIHQIKGYVFLFYTVFRWMRSDLFPKRYKLKSFTFIF